MLGIEELLDLEEAIKSELDENLTGILTKLNRSGRLDDLLSLLEMEHLLDKESGYQVYKSGKIVVIGQTSVKVDALLSIGRKLGIDKERFEFYLEYEDAKSFDFRKLQWQPSYSAILVGPMPHSGVSKGEAGSIISAIETQEGYPPIVRLGQESLKITKSNFKQKLQDLIEQGKIT